MLKKITKFSLISSCVFSVFFCLPSCQTTEQTRAAKPKTVVFAGQPNDREFKALLEETVTKYDLTGLQAAVFTHQEILNLDAVGVANKTTKRSLQKNDPMHLGNCGELLTGLVAAALIEQGKIRWDSKLTDVLAIRTSLRPEYQAITLRDCLSHQTKLPRCDDEKTLEDAATFRQGKNVAENRSDFVTYILRQDPIETISYSYADCIIAIAMLERASGKSFEALAAELVMKPLGITAKTTETRTTKVEHYTRKGSASEWSIAEPMPPVFTAANFYMSVGDYCRLLQETMKVYKKKDKKDKLGQDLTGKAVSLRLIEEMQLFKPKTAVFNMLGQRLKTENSEIYCTTGSSNGSTAHYYLFPARNMGIVFLLNGADRTNEDENALDALLAKLMKGFELEE